MNRLLPLTLAALVLAGAACSKCGAAGVVDAGKPAPHVKRSIDLRSAVTLIFPENRGTRVLSGDIRLTREVRGLPSVRELTTKTLTAESFVPDTDGGIGGVRAPFHLTLDRDTEPAQWTIALPLDPDTVEKLYTAPNALSSMDLALWLPKDPALTISRERFELTLEYEGMNEHRTDFLVRQLFRLLTANSQWSHRPLPTGWGEDPSDGGLGVVPSPCELTFDEKASKAVLDVHRDGAHVRVHYTLVTDEGPP